MYVCVITQIGAALMFRIIRTILSDKDEAVVRKKLQVLHYMTSNTHSWYLWCQ